MKTFKQIQESLLTESKNTLDPAGVPNFVFDKLNAHEKMRYKMMWKKMDLPTDFEERIKAMGGKSDGTFFDFGEKERKDGDFPSEVEWNSNGQKHLERYYKNGKKHRDGDKPAVIWWHENGQKELEWFFKNGKLHRDGDKPAEIWWYENGQKHFEIYFKNGNKHRDGDKPGDIRWYKNGQKQAEGFYKNGKEYTP